MSDSEPRPRHPGGRPSKYEPRFCEEVVAFCREGYSLTGFAGSIGVCRDTIAAWATEFPEFSVAVKDAKAAAALSYEQDCLRIRKEGGAPGSATLVLFGLKNFAGEDYKDRAETVLSGPNGPIEIKDVSARELLTDRIARISARSTEGDDPSGSDGSAG